MSDARGGPIPGRSDAEARARRADRHEAVQREESTMRETATVPVPARDRRQLLERRLAAYALASGSIMVASDRASAGIFYSGVRDVPIGNQQTVNLNLNDTG